MTQRCGPKASIISDKQNFSFLPSCISDSRVTRQKSHFRCKGLLDSLDIIATFQEEFNRDKKMRVQTNHFHLVF
jgi:hypothetical protein